MDSRQRSVAFGLIQLPRQRRLGHVPERFAVDVIANENARDQADVGAGRALAQDRGERLGVIGGLRPRQPLHDVGDGRLHELAVFNPELLSDDLGIVRAYERDAFARRHCGGPRLGGLVGLGATASHAQALPDCVEKRATARSFASQPPCFS